jgi:hypothetical protein
MRYTISQAADLAGIKAAVAAYSRGLDRLDEQLMSSAYWPDGTDDRYDGDIATFVEQSVRLHSEFSWTMHCLQNHLIEFDADSETARGELYVTALLQGREPPALHTFYGRYLDLYERRHVGEWRILRRTCVHEGSATVAVTPAPFSFDRLRPGALDRPLRGRPLGP